MPSKDLTRLEELTPRLAQLIVGYVRTPAVGTVEYVLAGGRAVGFNCYSSPELGVQRVMLPAGADFPSHIHEEQEYLIVYKGHVVVRVGDQEIDLLPGGCANIPSNVRHSSHIIEDSWMLAVTIPRDEGYPRDRTEPE